MKSTTLAKTSFCFSFLCSLFDMVAQSNDFTVKRFRLDSITAIGKPNGEKISEEIDKEGGKVFSEDGRVELIFPEGALSKKKKITIQSVVNHVANGQGNAYLMEPSGIQFHKPVTLVFHYSDDELAGTSAQFKGIACQDEKGKWQSLSEISLDTVSKTITTQINHFSSYSSFDKIVLKPGRARAKVEKSIQMEIHFAASDLDNDIALPPTIPAPQWLVNGIVYGNSNVGRIVPVTFNTNFAKYTAPASVPDENPVAVSAKLVGMEFTFNRRTFRDPSLISNILIYDKAYRITMDLWFDDREYGVCTMWGGDHGEFTLVLEGTRAMIKEISNRNLQISFNPCPCPIVWVNRPLPGPINTAGASRIDIAPASLPSTPFRKVRIMLSHAYSPLPIFKVSCPNRDPVPPVAGVFLPPLIEFEANNESEQKITLSELTKGSMKNDRRNGINILIKLIEENDK